MARLDAIVSYLDEYLDAAGTPDYGPNGLQVEGRDDVNLVVAGVSASLALLERAVELEADAVLVHHGILWNHGTPRVQGGFRKRLRALLLNDIALLAYHLPLDRHLEVGTAATVARGIGLRELEPFGDHRGLPVGVVGMLDGLPVAEVIDRVRSFVGRQPLHFEGGPAHVRSAAVVTGEGMGEFQTAIERDVDLFITGEPKERSMDLAREEGMHFVAAGHYHTEAPGVRALASHLADRFDIQVTFVDLPNPV